MDDARLPDPEVPMRVLFVHPAYPNTFTTVIEALATRPGVRCSVLLDNRAKQAVYDPTGRIRFLGYDPDSNIAQRGAGMHDAAFTPAAAHGLSIARALRVHSRAHRFDVVLSHASRGCTFYLRHAIDGAIVSYCEHPGYFMQSARAEYPQTLPQYVHDMGYRALVLASVLHSDLGLVASEHARKMFPAEVQHRVRVAPEGFPLSTPPKRRPALRAQLGLPEEGLIVGFFARSLEAVRGFDTFVEVAKRIQAARNDIHVLVIGAEQTLYGNELLYLRGQSFKHHALQRSGVDEGAFIWRDYMPYQEFIAHLHCIDLAILPYFEGASNWSVFHAMFYL
jgi:glycosyltransferase involved in cell wall biosynthesis